MKFYAIISLSSCLILSSCAAPRGHVGVHSGGRMGGSVHGGAGALVILGLGVVIGSIIATLPDKHTPVGPEQYYSDGVFYRNSSHGYEVIAAPIGVRVDQIPADHRIVRYQNHDYFESKGAWYSFDARTKQYQVVSAPSEGNFR